ncbi:MAG: hypothetical protein R2780_00160 [Crocinitomicaceae bacterium]
MKTTTSILLVFFSFILNAQNREEGKTDKINLANKEFKVNGSCFEDESRESYELTDFERGVDEFNWGYFISFTEHSFTTSYSAPCGNDCFTSVSGTYEFVGLNKIKVFVSTIRGNGFCQKESEEPNRSYGTYSLEQTAVGVNIKKVIK